MDEWDLLLWSLVGFLVGGAIIALLVVFTLGPQVEHLATIMDCKELTHQLLYPQSQWFTDRIFDVFKVKCVG